MIKAASANRFQIIKKFEWDKSIAIRHIEETRKESSIGNFNKIILNSNLMPHLVWDLLIL